MLKSNLKSHKDKPDAEVNFQKYLEMLDNDTYRYIVRKQNLNLSSQTVDLPFIKTGK